MSLIFIRMFFCLDLLKSFKHHICIRNQNVLILISFSTFTYVVKAFVNHNIDDLLPIEK